MGSDVGTTVGSEVGGEVGVDVVGANQALGELVEDVIVFGEQLARHIKTHGIGSLAISLKC